MNENIDITQEDKVAAWEEVMNLAEKYGFIRFAYAGFAMLNINEEEMKVKAKKDERVTPDPYYSLYGAEPGEDI